MSRAFIKPATLGVAAALASAPALAADRPPLEEIVVTADFRSDTLDRIAGSITVLDERLLADAGVQHFEDLLMLVPNLNWSGESSRPRFLQLRGIGERSQYEGAPNPSVGFIIDDVDFSGIGTVATLFDMEQVEVLRGPQGTRYGANALAGLVYMRSRAPGDEFEFDSELTVGGDNVRAAGVAFGGPIDDRFSYRIAAHRWKSDGFRYNAFLDRSDTNNRDELTTRGRLRFEPDDTLQVDLTLMWVDLDNGYDAFAVDNSFTTQSDRPGRDVQESRASSLRVNWVPGDVRVVSISSWADSDILVSFDGDWGNDAFWGDFAPYDFFSSTDRRRRTWNQELRLMSEPGTGFADGRVDWIVGAYAMRLREDNVFLDLFNEAVFRELDIRYRADNLAIFGELDFSLAERWQLTTGLRLEQRRAQYRDTQGLDFDPRESMLGGAVELSWFATDALTAYASASRGYKAGGFNLGLSIPAGRREFDTEYLWNFETGIRGRWLDGRLQANAAAFYMLRRDQQVDTSLQVDPADPLSFVFFTDNAARGFNYGVEADVAWQFMPHWRLLASVGLLETEFREFPGGPVGRDQAHAPNYQYSLGLEYRDAGGWFGRVEVNGRDAFYFSNSHDQRSSSYNLVNARVGWEGERWSVSAWGRNLLQQTYAVRGFFFGLEPPDFADRLYVRRGDPRQVGVTVSYGF